MVTPPRSETPALESVTANLYSDLLIYHMGKGLADDITQGAATGDMFRSTPLWGVGQRLFFLHDGRTSDQGALLSGEQMQKPRRSFFVLWGFGSEYRNHALQFPFPILQTSDPGFPSIVMKPGRC